MKLLSPDNVASLIAQGKAIVIYKDHALNLSAWLKFHPGGDKAVFHMVGRDATDEMLAYHSEETINLFKRWSVGRVELPWRNMLPPIQGAIYRENTRSEELSEKLDRESFDMSSDTDRSSDEETEKYKKSGYIDTVRPIVPQGDFVSDENVLRLFPVQGGVVDPQQAYDNRLTLRDIERLPKMDYATQEALRTRYNQLHLEVIKAGLYRCNYWDYGRELIKIASLFLYSFSLLLLKQYMLSAVFIAMAWHQMVFIAHDAGHVAITHRYQVDNFFGMLISSWFGGLSLGWWKRNHNVHHLVPNDPVHDPDIQHLPFFAVSVRLFNDVYLSYYEKVLWFDAFAKRLIPYQNFTYYPILAFGRFNLYRLLWAHLLFGQGPRHGKAAWFRWFEFCGLSFFFYWFFYLIVGQRVHGWGNKVAYVLVSHVCTMLVHVQITLSHFAMSTADLGTLELFVSRQLRTTMDVDCPPWLDFFHGGLQFQAIHHIFPRMPRHNFRKAQPMVVKFCEDVGLPYSIYGFGEGNDIIISKLGEIGKQCRIMLECTKKLKEENTPITEMI